MQALPDITRINKDVLDNSVLQTHPVLPESGINLTTFNDSVRNYMIHWIHETGNMVGFPPNTFWSQNSKMMPNSKDPTMPREHRYLQDHSLYPAPKEYTKEGQDLTISVPSIQAVPFLRIQKPMQDSVMYPMMNIAAASLVLMGITMMFS